MTDLDAFARVDVGILGYGERLPSVESISLLQEDPNVSCVRILWSQPSPAVAQLLKALEADTPNLQVEFSSRNLGSAGGYSRLLQLYATKRTASFLLLLDDDLRLDAECIPTLLAKAREHSADLDSTLLLAYRPGLPEFRALVQEQVPLPEPTPGCCVGFDIANSFWPRRRGQPHESEPGIFTIGSAPWGGLLIPDQALARLGLPREDLFLYADDSDLTLRFTRGGGTILLVVPAVAHDRDEAWNAVAGSVSNLSRRILHLPENKVYHEVRNRSYIGRRYYPGQYAAYLLNKGLFLAGAYVIGLLHGRFSRARLIHRAVNAGESMASQTDAG